MKSNEKKRNEKQSNGKKSNENKSNGKQWKEEKKKRASSSKSKSNGRSNQKPAETLKACATMLDDRIGLLNEKIDLIKQNEGLLSKKIDLLNQPKNPNKSSTWPFATYETCFIAKVVPHFRFLLPTAMVRIEVNGSIFGPFRALLDTGAQPTIISHTLFKHMRCSASEAMKRMVGVGSHPFTIKRKTKIIIRPWFQSQTCVYDQAYVLPHQNDWKPILPSTELKVEQKDEEFRNSLADPVYFSPHEVHIILGVGFVAKVFEHKIGQDINGTALFSTQFGNVIMGELDENAESNECNEQCLSTVVDDTMNEKLNKMLERLWEMDKADDDDKTKRTVEQEMV